MADINDVRNLALRDPGDRENLSMSLSAIFFIGKTRPTKTEIARLIAKLLRKPGIVKNPELRLPIKERKKLIVALMASDIFRLCFLRSIKLLYSIFSKRKKCIYNQIVKHME